MKLTLNGRPVEATEIDYGRDACDTHIVDAYFLDMNRWYHRIGIRLGLTTDQLTEDQLIELESQESDELYSATAEHWVCEAEDRADFLADR